MPKKKIVQRVDRNLARRLREARREIGLSTRAVSAKMAKRLKVSHNTIASYEKGTHVPAIDVLAALAEVYARPLNWFLESRESLSGFRYRNLKPRSGIKERRQYEAIVGKWVDGYFGLEHHLGCPLRDGLRGRLDASEMPPAALAEAVRTHLGLHDSDPVPNVVEVLESARGVRVLELRTSLPMEGASAMHGPNPVLLVNPTTTNERLRMNAAHELALILYNDCDVSLSGPKIDRQAYDFASAFLLPDAILERAVEGRSFLRLIQYKERYGISVSSMVYRAERLKLIRTTTARWLWVEMSKRGWKENEPGYVWRDRAIRFETMLESAVHSKSMTWADAENVTGIREDDLRQRIEDATKPAIAPLNEEQGGEPAILRFPN